MEPTSKKMTPAINEWNQIKAIFLRLFYMVFPNLSLMDKACGRRSMLWDNLLVNSSLYNAETTQSFREWGGSATLGDQSLYPVLISSGSQRNTFSSVLILLHLSLDGGGHGSHEGLSPGSPPFVTIVSVFLTEFSSWCPFMPLVLVVTLPPPPNEVLFIFQSVVSHWVSHQVPRFHLPPTPDDF